MHGFARLRESINLPVRMEYSIMNIQDAVRDSATGCERTDRQARGSSRREIIQSKTRFPFFQPEQSCSNSSGRMPLAGESPTLPRTSNRSRFLVTRRYVFQDLNLTSCFYRRRAGRLVPAGCRFFEL